MRRLKLTVGQMVRTVKKHEDDRGDMVVDVGQVGEVVEVSKNGNGITVVMFGDQPAYTVTKENHEYYESHEETQVQREADRGGRHQVPLEEGSQALG